MGNSRTALETTVEAGIGHHGLAPTTAEYLQESRRRGRSWNEISARLYAAIGLFVDPATLRRWSDNGRSEASLPSRDAGQNDGAGTPKTE